MSVFARARRLITWPNVAIVVVIVSGVINASQISHSNTLGHENHRLTVRVARDEAALKANIAAQVPNRVKNVGTWCGAINAGRNYDRAFVTKFGFRYQLPNLDCKAIEQGTAASANHRP